ncbi:DUF418 domain-containing protein [Sphingomonas sp. AX6]|uniref:DUF418 domain-containing protein n=1 Tax=Sphingomonas sp. AX6 TaxID=2653171 RepID=UPI0012F1A014|nr:DUF418 domain-containing protein [Sphingomonas sp. AX6]VXD00915.1 conserved membrane hypothetical protein [Sphingomonas sp. AX6]
MANTSDRIAALDIVRGVAVMGILAMNIAGFALIFPAYFNPLATGDASAVDRGVYLFNYVLFDGKMRGLFSLLFGASMLLVVERASAKGENPARVHYCRMVTLLGFGLIHLWLVWWGDILAHYAIVGMVAYLAVHQSARTLFGLSAALIGAHTLFSIGLPVQIATLEAELPAREAAAALQGYANSFGVPDAAHAARETAIYRGDYSGIFADRTARFGWSPLRDLQYMGMETLGLMLIGMGLLKTGLFRGEWRVAKMRRWAAIGIATGFAIYLPLAAWMASADFSLLSVVTATLVAPVPLRPLVIVGIACLILLASRPGGPFTERIAAAGRMAFTNYLMTSLICTAIFYGYGLGLFGALSRLGLWGVVLAIWIGMLAWSKPWLERFAYGPLEWLWRSMARGSVQPMRRLV